MNDKNPFVTVITVNYNGKKYLKDCFNSLYELDYPPDKLEIIMVDNGSTDDSMEFIKNNFPKIKIIHNNVNNYCKANNLGIKEAKGEFIALLNNDTIVDKNWLKELLEIINGEKNIGMVSSKILFMDGKLQGTGHYELPNFYWSDRGFKEEDRGQYDSDGEIDSASNCSILYRKACLDNIDLLDEDFFIFLEDVDMSIRCRNKGWKILYAPKSIVHHQFHASTDKELIDFLCEKNRLLLIAKHYPQKLADAFFGKGYFTAINDRNDLIKILPDVFTKLIKHHNAETIVSVLPNIFENLDKIFNLEKDHLIKQLDSQKELFQQKNIEISNLKNEINQIYNSRAYRFIAQPVWKISNMVRKLKKRPPCPKQRRISIIKSAHITADETKKATEYIRNSNSDADISIISNLSNANIIKLFFGLRRRNVDEVILLIGKVVPRGYRRSKLLAFLSGAKTVNLFFIDIGKTAPLSLLISYKGIFKSLYFTPLLGLILIWFIIFVVFPMKLKKFFKR